MWTADDTLLMVYASLFGAGKESKEVWDTFWLFWTTATNQQGCASPEM